VILSPAGGHPINGFVSPPPIGLTWYFAGGTFTIDDMIPVHTKPSERKAVSERPKRRPEVGNQTNGRFGAAPRSVPIQPIARFFQEPDLFRTLKSKILPQLLKTRPPEHPIRVWVPGVSSGEELYSIAICLLEGLNEHSASLPIRLFGTDIAEPAIQTARAAIYPGKALFRVSQERLRRFFVKEGDNYRLTRTVRGACIFACHDLTSDPPFSHLDLIRCRDLLTHMEPVLQKQILNTFHYALRDTGFLLLGESEAPSVHSDLFKMVDQQNRLFVKRPGVTRAACDYLPWSRVASRRAARYVVLPAASVGKELEAGPRADWRKNARKSETQCLNEELEGTKQYREAIVQQYATINELKTANEQAECNVEELQSVNEELQSAKDELQSTNENLALVNGHVQERNLELAKLTDDLTNTLAGVNIPIVILGGDRRIRRATPNAEKLLHVRPADAGRPISDIRVGLALTDFDGLISTVLSERRELEREVRGEDNRWYSLRLRPYWTAAGKIDGVLLSLLDIHEIKETQEASRRGERFVSAILDTAGWTLLVVVLDPDGRIVHFNRACQVLSGYSLEEARGRRPWDFLPPPHEPGGFKRVFQHLKPMSTQEHRGHWVTKDGRRRLIAWWISVTADEDGRVQHVIGSGIDITEQQQAWEQARQSEAAVRALLETAAQAIIGINSAGSVVLANAAAEAMFGHPRKEMLDQPIEMLLPARLRSPQFGDWSAFLQTAEDEPMGRGIDNVGVRKDGTEFPVEVNLSHVATADGNLAVAFITDITERRHYEENLRRSEAEARASQQKLRELTAGLLEGHEEERRRVSRELHDDLNQKLAMLAVELGGIEAKLPPSDRVIREQLQSFEKRLNGLSDDVRRTAYQLHPSILEHLGLADALETYCGEFSAQEKIKVDFRLRKVPGTIPKGIALCLYRVAQEALRNIARHSGSRRASVTLAGKGAGLTLTLEDHGRGFDPAVIEGKRGLGLISMKERVSAAGGLLAIEARPGAGTRVRVQIPVGGGSE
jgi:PAS domain S-box-containing protein